MVPILKDLNQWGKNCNKFFPHFNLFYLATHLFILTTYPQKPFLSGFLLDWFYQRRENMILQAKTSVNGMEII